MICFMNDNPKFYRKVEFGGKVIATIKAKTAEDAVEIEERAWSKRVVKKHYIVDINFEKAGLIRTRQAMTGDEKVGWDSDKEVTEANISVLPPKIRAKILSEIEKLDKSWTDGTVSKN